MANFMNDKFHYYDNTPKGDTYSNHNNCVCRAISLGTGYGYNEIERLLLENSRKCKCDIITKSCYRKLLEQYFGLVPRQALGKSVRMIAKAYPHNNVIMRIQAHLTCSVNGTLYDIFNCLDETVDEFWVVK